MNIIITTPSIKSPHGGTRILNEWAVRLSEHHNVKLFVEDGNFKCDWYTFPPQIKFTRSKSEVFRTDCLIIGSPHSIYLQKYAKKKCFIFLQMLEHLFNPTNTKFAHLCNQFYKSPHPMFCLAQWNIDYLRGIGRKGDIIHIGNGTNFEHFPIETNKKDKIVLVEGWECNNFAKDTDKIGPKVAQRLKKDGYKILAYSQLPLKTLPSVPNEFYYRPNLEKMNELYSRAKIMLKASHYDARSLSPLEAMTKGTPTVRAITSGDDDLVGGFNCMRVAYDEHELYNAANEVLSNAKLYDEISKNCVDYIQKHDWEYWMKEIRKCIEN